MSFSKTLPLALLLGATFIAGAATAQTVTPTTPFEMPTMERDETDEERYERMINESTGSIDGVYGPEWSGDVTANASISTGNSESTDLGIFARAGKTSGLYTHQLTLGYQYADDEDDTNKNKLYGSYQLNRSFGDGLFGLTDRTYAYGVIRGAYDQEGAYRHDYFAGAGLGYKVISTPQTRWVLEAGPGVRFYDKPSFDMEGDIAFRGASRFAHRVNDNLSFQNDTYAIFSEEDTNFISDSYAKVGLTRNMSARIGFRLDHHTNPPAGYDSTDTTTYAGVSFGF